MLAQTVRPIPSPAWMTLCRTCLLRSVAANRPPRRSIHLATLRKRELAQEQWDARAIKIKKGEEPNLWEVFKERGYVKDIAGTDRQISELMRCKRIGAYVGIDPTAASLHLGHLLPLMPLFWMYMHGYRAVSLVGGATAKVGDPTGRLKSREDIPAAERSMYVTKIHYQVKRIWQNVDSQARRFEYVREWAWARELVNNSSWYNSMSFMEIVSRLFARMRVGPMLSRETAKRKMTEGDGMSVAELIYPLIQAWDWWEMFSGPKGVYMQIGGSDQYGNIVAGVDAIKLLRDTEPDPAKKMPKDLLHTPVGFTTPLLTDSSGTKFGKSTGNAIWLDPFMTSSFDLYGYFMRRPDADVEKLLKLFTFLPMEKIRTVMKEHESDPSQRSAHHTLAFEVLALVHGMKEAQATQVAHKQMFANGGKRPEGPTSIGEVTTYPSKYSSKASDVALNFRPDVQLPESLIMGNSIPRILYAAGLAESANDAHRLVAQQGAYVGGAPGRPAHGFQQMNVGEVTFQSVKSWFKEDTLKLLIGGKILILRRGKHFIRIVEMVSDEEWVASGKSYPGEAGKGRMRLLRERLIEANNGKNPNLSTDELARLHETLVAIERSEDLAHKENPLKPRPIEFPPERTRAAQLLDTFSRNMEKRMPAHFHLSVKEKSIAIDKVLNEAKAVLRERRKELDLADALARKDEPAKSTFSTIKVE
ncbi:tRNA synthetase class I [Xylaria nigripes]|nr:tRNA synthetase class I [Xylaria nigripes]